MEFGLNGRVMEITARYMINAGYAGCDQNAVKAHIKELAAIGVDVPGQCPTFYPVPVQQLLQAEKIQTGHGKTSAEIEYVFICSNGKSYLTVGSDHSDRDLEAYSVCAAKQICPNVVAGELWRYDDVADHLDKLRLLCEVGEQNDTSRVYQDGRVSDLLSPEQLLEMGASVIGGKDDIVLYSGTIPTIGDISFGTRWRITMADTKLNRKISFMYEVEILPPGIE